MLKKTITFTDFNGETQTRDYYFNLTKAELIEMELSADGNSMIEYNRRISESRDGKAIIQSFKEIIAKSYGVRSADGSSFVKKASDLELFEGSEAYSVLFLELVTDAEAGAAFMNGIVPSGFSAAEVEQTAADQARARSEASLQGYLQAEPKTVVVPETGSFPESRAEARQQGFYDQRFGNPQ